VLNPVGIAGKTRADFDRMMAKRRAKQGIKEVEPPTLGEELGVVDGSAVAASATATPERVIGEVLLRAEEITVTYGGLRAVDSVSIEVRAGEIVGLIGPNGAGKTSFIDAITGFTNCRGNVYLLDERLTDLPAHKRARKGLVRTWQSVELFDDLSVRENLLVASHRPSVWRTVAETVSAPDAGSGELGSVLDLLGLEGVIDAMPSELSQGQRKLVGIARALVTKPRLMCLDEPAAGLDTNESEELGARLRRLADGGQSMLLVDHDMGLVLGICDEVVVLEFGKVIARGPAAVVRRDPRVIAAYLGGAAGELAGATEGEHG
jgi:branched-chain amino acid transport system ATP-binding protein